MYQHDPTIRALAIDAVLESDANWDLHGRFDPSGRDKWLCDDVLKNGILDPVLVTPQCNLKDGHRRLRAGRHVGLKVVPAIQISSEGEGDAFRSAQLGRQMSVYAKCVLYRPEIDRLLDLGRARQLSALNNQADPDESDPGPERDFDDEWAGLEGMLNCSRRTLTRGVRLLSRISEMRGSNLSADKSLGDRVTTVFRERGLKPALRLLGDCEESSSEDGDPEEPDCADWADSNTGRSVRDSRRVALAKKPDKSWITESYRLLAKVETSLKDHGLLSAKLTRALDDIETALRSAEKKSA